MERSRVIILLLLLLLVECFSIPEGGEGGTMPTGRVDVELVEKLLEGCRGKREALNGGRSAGIGLKENG